MLDAMSREVVERTCTGIVAAVLLALAGGCATSNHPLARGGEQDVPGLVRALEEKEAEAEKAGGEAEDEDSLYKVRYIPFTHLELMVFTEKDEVAAYPEGHVFIELRSWLPLFGIVDGEVELFDSDHASYESIEFRSALWGLWTRKRGTVQTVHGPRVERNGTLFWVLDWGPSVEYGGVED